MDIVYSFFGTHPQTAEFIARIIFGALGGYVAWAWIFKIQNGENDTSETPDSLELFHRVLVGAILGMMFAEMWANLAIFVGYLNPTAQKVAIVLDNFTWVVAGFVGIMGKPFAKKFLAMLGEDVFDFAHQLKDKFDKDGIKLTNDKDVGDFLERMDRLQLSVPQQD